MDCKFQRGRASGKLRLAGGGLGGAVSQYMQGADSLEGLEDTSASWGRQGGAQRVP